MKTSFLLINPEAIPAHSYYDIFRVVHQMKINGKPTFSFDSLIKQNMKLLYGGSNEEVMKIIRDVDAANLKLEIGKLGKIHAKQKGGISFDTYMQRTAPRMFQELISRLANVSGEMKLYHRTRNKETGNVRVAPCTFGTVKPVLSFSIVNSTEKGLLVNGVIDIAGEKHPLSDFTVSSFLVEKDNTYYLLSNKDIQTLDWLKKASPEQYAHNAEEFSDKIISVLERDYDVAKEDIFKVNIIDIEPQHAVYLSEISDTYLMFTPRWDYEGFVIESTDQAEKEEIRRGEVYKVIRHKESELAFVEKLRALHPNFERQRNGTFYLTFDDAKKKHWFLKVYQQLLADNVQIVGMDMLSHFRYSPHSIETKMTIGRTVESTMHLNIQISFGDENIELSNIQRTLYNGQKFVLLKDDSIGIITDEWYDKYGIIFKHGKIQKGELVIPQWVLLSIEEKNQSKELQPVISKDWWKEWEDWQKSTEPTVRVPGTIKATLRPYQQKGFEWMVLMSKIGAGACLADDMGLGKTLQTITFLEHTLSKDKRAKCIIVAPLSLVFNWRQEIEKFAPHQSTYVFHQGNRDVQEFINSHTQIMITSYGTLRSAIEELSLVPWNTVVIDESHNIKNPGAQITKAVYRLSAKNRIALSGTPVMNNTFDIYSQLNFLLPSLLGGPEFFKREYANPIDRDMNAEKTIALQKVTSPFVLRRTKKQVAADLPDKTEAVMWCEMGEHQKEAYENIKKQIKANVFLDIENNGLAKAKFNILQGIMKLRQICCAPSMVKDESITTTSSVKLNVLMDELRDNVGGSKSLVFSQYLGMLEMVAQACKAEGIPYLYFDGSTPLSERAEMVNKFQDESSPERVFLISLKAGNAGLNLTAAEYVFLLDPWWNNAVEQQAIDRTHRIGQTKNIFAYKLVCRNTIEEKILNLQQKKKQLSDELVTEEEGFVKHLSQQDIEFLFE